MRFIDNFPLPAEHMTLSQSLSNTPQRQTPTILSPGIYFITATLSPAAKQDQCLLVEVLFS